MRHAGCLRSLITVMNDVSIDSRCRTGNADLLAIYEKITLQAKQHAVFSYG